MATPKKDPKDYVKTGRPTEYDPSFCQQAREMLRKGYAKVEIAAKFDVNRKTINEWAEKYPEFGTAIEQSVDLSEAWWTKKGRTNLDNKNFNSRLYELNMMNRFGWNKKTEGKQEVKLVPHDEMLKELK